MVDPFFQLIRDDPRYKPEAYEFVRKALSFAQDELRMPGESLLSESEEEESEEERHLTGQQLCEAIRRYAQRQFGYMAIVVLKSWGITTTGDFGEIVYNMIRIGHMRKSPNDRREHFDDVYDFCEAFQKDFKIQLPPS